jgi:hypothetical protein
MTKLLEENKSELNALLSDMPGYESTLCNYIKIIQQALDKNDYKSYRHVLHGDKKHDSQLFRKIHDYFGWMAKNTHSRRGGCAGALYRSENFLSISKNRRIGTKKNQNIHIEHVIPINMLPRLVWGQRENLKGKPEDIFNFVLKVSLCAAVNHPKDRDNIDKSRQINGQSGNWRDEHPGLVRNGDAAIIDSCLPFLRYMGSGVKIYSTNSGEEIQIEKYTYEEHLNALNKLSVVFQWANYCPKTSE